MVRITLVVSFLFFSFQSFSQVLLPERTTTWEKAGLTTTLQAPQNHVSIADFGADDTGLSSCNTAYEAAIESLNGHAGTIYFPAGQYYFTSGISIPDSVFLKGESDGTELRFNLGGTGDLIRMSGTTEPTEYAIAQNAVQGALQIELSDASGLMAGDVIRLYQYDEDHMFSSWAYGTLGQVVEIEAVEENILTLADPLNHHYPLSRNPFVKKLNPRRGAGIECMRIVREDASTGQTDNIHFNAAFNCVVRNVELENCNFAHISMNASAHILVEGCYMHHAHAYGGGGQGYGVVAQSASSFCLTQNNVFNRLRHSMLIQNGANGNVFGYNYSFDPYWISGYLPTNAAGDAVLHGNYTYLNLFEGNTVQNIVVDASHGSNGPFNTFFRNRAELYGFFSDQSTPTDSMNIIGNEITNSGFPYGLFMVNGNGHYVYGNNINGSVNPIGTSEVTTKSLYLSEFGLPDFISEETFPLLGFPLSIDQNQLEAEQRFDTEEFVNCASIITGAAPIVSEDNTPYALMGNVLEAEASALPAVIEVYAVNGALLHQQLVTSTHQTLSFPGSHGAFVIRMHSQDLQHHAMFKYVLVR